MTDREKLEALLADFGVEPSPTYGYEQVEPGEVVLLARTGGVEGYNGFFARFTFDETGKFQKLGVFE